MRLSLVDVAVLLRGLLKAAVHKNIGHLDSEASLTEMRIKLNKTVTISDTAVESAVYSCRALKEEGQELDHPDGHSLESFIRKLTPPGQRYNYEYSMFEEKMRDDDA